MIKQVIRASATAFIFIMALHAGVAGAHGNVAMEQDSCMRRAGGGSMLHLSVYQPEIEPSAHYCTEIPNVGETYLVIDLVDQALRDMPVGMEIVKGGGADSEIIKAIKPIYHPSGSLSQKVYLEQGEYTVTLKGEAVPPVEYTYPLRVQMINYSALFQKAIGPTIAFLAIMFIGYKIIKTKKVQKWLASRYS